MRDSLLKFAIRILLLAVTTGRAAAQGGPPTMVVVRSTTDCPTAAAVETTLRGLLPAAMATGGEAVEPDVADLRAEQGVAQGATIVRLRTATGELVAEKALSLPLTCLERADAAAVIIAAWEARLQSGARASLPAPSVPPAPIPRAAPPAIDHATPATLVASTAGPEETSAWRIDAGAGLFASLQGSDISPGIAVELEVAPRSSSLSLGVGALAIGSHATALSAGRGAWWRAGGVVDGRWRVPIGVAELEPRLAFLLTRLEVEGRSFPSTGYDIFVDPGALAGVRLLQAGKRARIWLDLALAYWPRQHVLVVGGTNRETTMPRTEVLLGIGVAFGRAR